MCFWVKVALLSFTHDLWPCIAVINTGQDGCVHLLAVLQDSLFSPDAALASGRIGFPFPRLNVDVHVGFPAEHGDLRLGQESGTGVRRHLRQNTSLSASSETWLRSEIRGIIGVNEFERIQDLLKKDAQ